MAKNVFIVNAMQSDANGNYTTASGFPKQFSSDSYHTADPVLTARRRANSSAYGKASEYYAVDNFPLWKVTIENAKGDQLLKLREGDFPSSESEEQGESE